MKNILKIAALGLFLSVGANASAQTGSAKDSDTKKEQKKTEKLNEEQERPKLKDRIKSVQRKKMVKKKRFEIYPYFGMDLNDSFYQHYIVGAAVAYHMVDALAFEVRGGYVLGSSRSSAHRFLREGTDSIAFNPPQFKYHADIDVQWSPIYGKLALFGEHILHFDTYLSVGGGVFGTDVADGSSSTHPAVNIGVGQRYYINRWLSIRGEVRNYVFADNRNNESDIQNLMIAGFFVSGFFPMSFTYEYQ